MIKIAICDDDVTALNYLKEKISEYYHDNCQVFTYNKMKIFVSYIKENKAITARLVKEFKIHSVGMYLDFIDDRFQKMERRLPGILRTR